MKELSVTDDAASARPRSESPKGSFEDQGKTVLEINQDDDVIAEDDDADQRSASSRELNQLDPKAASDDEQGPQELEEESMGPGEPEPSRAQFQSSLSESIHKGGKVASNTTRSLASSRLRRLRVPRQRCVETCQEGPRSRVEGI